MTETLAVDDLTFEVRRSSRRRHLELIVDRGGELILAAPTGLGPAVMTDFVRAKKSWVYSKLAEKEALWHPAPVKEFVSGEGFPYLGRSYRLLVVGEQDRPLKLEAGRFRLRRVNVAEGRAHFVHWYTSRATPWLRRRIVRWAAWAGLAPAGIKVQDLGYRWGSCSKDGSLNFHWATILLPPSVIDYVIVHELAHLDEPNHTPEFWARVARVLPDFEQRKTWLAEHGGEHVVL